MNKVERAYSIPVEKPKALLTQRVKETEPVKDQRFLNELASAMGTTVNGAIEAIKSGKNK